MKKVYKTPNMILCELWGNQILMGSKDDPTKAKNSKPLGSAFTF